jgi:hypothetical protein
VPTALEQFVDLTSRPILSNSRRDATALAEGDSFGDDDEDEEDDKEELTDRRRVESDRVSGKPLLVLPFPSSSVSFKIVVESVSFVLIPT